MFRWKVWKSAAPCKCCGRSWHYTRVGSPFISSAASWVDAYTAAHKEAAEQAGPARRARAKE